jgi:hypothetical protein
MLSESRREGTREGVETGAHLQCRFALTKSLSENIMRDCIVFGA